MKGIFIYCVLGFIYLNSCKPELMLISERELNGNSCEVAYYTTERFNDLESFKANFKRKDLLEATSCKCDTIFFDVLDTQGYRKQQDNVIFGVCMD